MVLCSSSFLSSYNIVNLSIVAQNVCKVSKNWGLHSLEYLLLKPAASGLIIRIPKFFSLDIPEIN